MGRNFKVKQLIIKIMGLLRSPVNPHFYLKVMNVKAETFPNTYDAAEECDRQPGRVEFRIEYNTFESYEKRVEWKTNPFITVVPGAKVLNFMPELPEGFTPITVNPSDQEEEKIIARAYVGLATLPEFEGWINYQPEVTV